MRWNILFATRKALCSSYTHPMKCKPHFFPYAPLWFFFPKPENISCIAGMKLVYNRVMTGPGLTPEETCVHILLSHSLPLQSQSKCSAFPYRHRGPCQDGKCCCNTHSTEYRHKCEGVQEVPRMAAVFQQRGDLPISLWPTQEQKCFGADSRRLTQR